MCCSLYDFARAYQEELRSSFDGRHLDQRPPNRFRTRLGDLLISMGEKLKGECVFPDLTQVKA